MLTTGASEGKPLFSEMGDWIQGAGGIVRDAAVVIGRDVGNIAKTVLVQGAETLGKGIGGFVHEVTPEGLREGLVTTVSQGTKLIMLVVGGLVVLAVANSIRKVS